MSIENMTPERRKALADFLVRYSSPEVKKQVLEHGAIVDEETVERELAALRGLGTEE